MNRTVAFAFAALLVSCAPAGTPPAETTDEFSDHVTIDSAHGYSSILGGPSYEWELQSTVGKEAPHEVGHRLFVWIYYKDSMSGAANTGQEIVPIHYRSAADDTAAQLPVEQIVAGRCGLSDQDCRKHDEIEIDVSDAALRAHVLKGYRIKVSPEDGDAVIVSLAPVLLAKQLTEVDNLVQGQEEPPRAPENAPHLGIAVIAATATPFADPTQGVIVIATTPSSPAAAAGIEPGDVLHAIGPEPVRASGDLARIMAEITPGSTVSLALDRGGKRFTAKVQL